MVNPNKKMTAAEARSAFHYEPKTGKFTWLNPTSSRVAAGGRAGVKTTTGTTLCLNRVKFSSARVAWLYTYGRFPKAPLFRLDSDPFNDAIANLREGLTGKVTAEKLQKFVTYNKTTGAFHWLARDGTSLHGCKESLGWDGKKTIRIGGKDHPVGRLAWLYVHGRWPRDIISYLNGDITDNRLKNLRESRKPRVLTSRTTLKADNTSGATGVEITNERKPYKAGFYHKGRRVYVGHYATIDAAVFARAKVRKSFGALGL